MNDTKRNKLSVACLRIAVAHHKTVLLKPQYGYLQSEPNVKCDGP